MSYGIISIKIIVVEQSTIKGRSMGINDGSSFTFWEKNPENKMENAIALDKTRWISLVDFLKTGVTFRLQE